MFAFARARFSFFFALLLVVGLPGAGQAASPPAPLVPVVSDTVQRPIAYHFVLTSLPANTPGDAALYLVGSFNNWQPADTQYRFRRQANGLFGLTLRTEQARLEYKVSRGSWAAIEGSGHGQVRANRVATRQQAQAGDVEVRVQSWEDLTGTFQFYSLYDLLLLFSCFQGVLLLIAIPSLQHANRAANRWLLWLLGLGAGCTLLTVVSSDRTVANAYPQLTLVPDFIWFVYGPLFYGYIRRLLFNEAPRPRQWLQLLPAVLQLLVYLPYFLLDSYEFQLRLVSHEAGLRAVLLTTGFVALLTNAAYWLACRQVIRAYTRQYEASVSYAQNLRYLTTVLGIQAVCLLLWSFLFGIVLASRWATFDVYTLVARNQALIWLVFSTLPYFLGYVVLHQPEIFRLVPAPADLGALPAGAAVAGVPVSAPMPVMAEVAGVAITEPLPALPRPPRPPGAPGSLDLPAAQATVAGYMRQHKPYLNPSLTIHELAMGLQLPPHVLSKVINEGFGQNFFDFVNSYRVDEFKQVMAVPQARQYTLLALALEVGFNSKTAFNRAFKKQTDQTPREYFSGIREE
ncbi:helix-turn-helix domain-containing protein [Hymenobacter elongatus]|uniref:Helix-turn-helix domain-containing protein n=1 Tax=Hymenobacter elongatus TaxID=877208 RepID=A0A4Z0PJW4_9BACT|nr:helix-turn-helix domain-containing protein [Hymenobacter elongatus]TGE15965.1 helix-turn-helix domain-containing protein [Hymenobacter elongatus]